MMRVLRVGTVLVFVIALVLFGLFYMKEQNSKDYTFPSIQIPSGVLDVSIQDTQDRLLEGVTAHDGKDGDITAKIVIESISKFSKDRTCVVTYAVVDSDKHVAKNTRTIRYTDYTEPEFYLEKPLVFRLNERVDVHQIIGAVDCIEGDISDKVTIVATDYTDKTVGVFSISLQATNKLGDVIYLDLPIYVEEINVRALALELSEYLIYVDKGETPVFEDYIASVSSNFVEIADYELILSSDFDCNTPGTYSVHFGVEDSAGRTGYSVLTVVVRG
jgi:hypothetical protein